VIRTFATVVLLFGVLVGARLLLTEGIGANIAMVLPQVLVVLSSLIVILHLERGDRPRRPWLLLGTGAAVLAGSRIAGFVLGADDATRELLLMVSNLITVAGMVDYVAMVRSSGLVEGPSGAARLALRILAGVAGVAAVVGLVVLIGRFVEAGWTGTAADWTRIAAVVSLQCDAVMFVAGAHLAATVWPLARGRAAHPYLLIGSAGVTFLVLDMIAILVIEGGGYGGFGVVLQYIVLLAWSFLAAAGVALTAVLRLAQAR
jgi:hypothetical protein